LEHLAIRLRPFVRHLVVLQGGMTPSERREATARLAGIPEDEPRLVLATGRYIGEGFDDARLDTLFLTMPVSWKGTLVQYAGRLHRLHPGKTEVRIPRGSRTRETQRKAVLPQPVKAVTPCRPASCRLSRNPGIMGTSARSVVAPTSYRLSAGRVLANDRAPLVGMSSAMTSPAHQAQRIDAPG
jgi:hypothetical protein